MGGNYTRIWLDAHNLGPELEQLGNFASSSFLTDSGSYFGHPWLTRQGKCFLFDHILEHADTMGVKLQLCLEAGSYFNPHPQHGSYFEETWDGSPYRSLPGVNEQIDFFTDPQAKVHYMRKLRYLLARYGYSPAVACWEFFNEVDEIWNPAFEENNANGEFLPLH